MALDLLTLDSAVHLAAGRPWVWALDQAMVLPLTLRRRNPLGVFAVLAAVGLAQWGLGLRMTSDAALLVALYTVAAHETRGRAVGAAAVLQIGVVIASIRFAPAGGAVLASLIFLTGLVAAAFFLGTTLRTRRDYLASLLDRAASLERDRDQQALIAATAERTRIAHEMHDIIAHSLAVMTTLADGAALANTGGVPAATGAMRQVSDVGRQALGDMRRLLGVLRADGPGTRAPQPDLDQLDALVEQTRQAGLPVRLTVSGAARPLPASTAAVVYRVVQEGLTNALKHAAEPSRVDVALTWSPGCLTVEVADDGGAGPAPNPPDPPGHGLAGMAERLALFGGTVAAAGRPEGGWRVRAVLPLDAAAGPW